MLAKSKPLSPKSENSNIVQVVASRSHISQETLDYIKMLKAKGKDVEIVSKGRSLQYCWVAEGKAVG